MFLVTCPDTDIRGLVPVTAIREHANTAHGVLTVVACHCGGDAVLRQGDQVAHYAPGATNPAADTRRAPVAA